MKKPLKILAVLFGLYLGIYNGHLALWKAGANTPEKIFPYRADLYPKADQAALEIGIPIEDPHALSKLLEDFLS